MTQRYNEIIKDSIEESISTKFKLVGECSQQIADTAKILVDILKDGGKILLCGNGGSAADCQHIAAELVVRLRGHVNRPALPAIALTVDPSIITAGGNDIGYENIFARVTEAYGRPGDVLVGLSTSGNSENVMNAMKKAKELGIETIGLLGNGGGRIKDLANTSVIVPSKVTARIQESHILVGHIWCEIIEESLFPELFEENLEF